MQDQLYLEDGIMPARMTAGGRAWQLFTKNCAPTQKLRLECEACGK
ncbi:hypothetical protein ATPR_1366 [Acetobacter tropicalis NBRC 101654]|uniref:Uncharacterized protein n=1 Tax=Acetobacter tropicalis NBRC 101654 TaxID=749388 RepID=F7VDB7_9PROT|nr:hypothetical protein ATPR_1366 [Acetobacter tropicalis NBRC 101654]